MSHAETLVLTLEDLGLAARRGDFAALGALADRLTASLAEVEAAPPAKGDLQAIQASAARVSALLDAVAQGLAAARRRMAEIDAVRRGLDTYGGDGRRRSLNLPAKDSRRV